MLAFVLWPLWKQLKAPLKSALADKFSVVGGQFKLLLSSTVDDLITAIQSAFFSTDQWKHLADAEVEVRKGKKKSFSYKAFPITSLSESRKIKAALIQRLRQNVKLDAVRTEAGVGEKDWEKTLDAYAGEVLRLGLSIAMSKMIRNEMTIDSAQYVVDLAEAEAIKVQGVSGHHKLVVLFTKYSNDASSRLKEANKYWKKRGADDVKYSLGEYDGFKAL
jgi:hypothetical protein